jgi:hypothetical protein
MTSLAWPFGLMYRAEQANQRVGVGALHEVVVKSGFTGLFSDTRHSHEVLAFFGNIIPRPLAAAPGAGADGQSRSSPRTGDGRGGRDVSGTTP